MRNVGSDGDPQRSFHADAPLLTVADGVSGYAGSRYIPGEQELDRETVLVGHLAHVGELHSLDGLGDVGGVKDLEEPFLALGDVTILPPHAGVSGVAPR